MSGERKKDRHRRGDFRGDLRKDLHRLQERKRRVPPIGSSAGPPVLPSSESESYRDVIAYRRDLPRRSPRSEIRDESAERVILEEEIESEEIQDPRWGGSLLVSNTVDRQTRADPVSRRFSLVLAAPKERLAERLGGLCGDAMPKASDVIFVDIETTGLGSTPLFLIGTMICAEKGFEVRQHFARSYAEEAAVIAHFLNAVRPKKLLVTFNGKSFDIPYVRTRAAANGVSYDLEARHFDLLHESRRRWKGQLPNYRLQTLERLVCGRVRRGDIPGAEIPDAYHDYVRTGNARQMIEVLKHNMLDLVTLADIMCYFE